jgi:hypothetical protein
VRFIVAVNLVMGLTPGSTTGANVGGLLGGLVFTWFAGPVWEVRQALPPQGGMVLADRREAREVLTGAATVILIFGALAVWGFVAPVAR